MNSTLSLILFSIFALIAIFNLYGVVRHLKNKSQDTFSFIPLIGLIVFILAMNSLNEAKPILWLFLLLDLGTLLLLFFLPSILYQVFLQSRFCKHAVYLSHDQKIILYKFKKHQILQWQRLPSLEKTPIEHGRLMAFGGDWQIEHDQFFLIIQEQKVAIAQIHEQSLIFTEILNEHYAFLQHTNFIQQK